MGIFTAIRNSLIIVFVVLGVYFAANFGEPTKNQLLSMVGWADVDVQGASTERAEKISGKIGTDIGNHMEDAKNQALNVSVGDALTTLLRVQKIPQDMQQIGEYVKTQAENVINSVGKKESKEEKK